MLVYHGSSSFFRIFDYDKMGKNGTSEGRGFYFTDNRGIALSYAINGYLYTVNTRFTKKLSSNRKTITKQQLKVYITELDKATDYLSNWGDAHYMGYQRVLNLAASAEYSNSDNDVDLICSICNGCGSNELALTILNRVLGYDSCIQKADWGNQKIYIATVHSAFEILRVDRIGGG